MKYLMICIFYLLPVSIACGKGNNARIDSLQREISIQTQDTDKVKLLLYISREYERDDTAYSFKYAREAISYARRVGWEKGVIRADVQIGRIYINHLADNYHAIAYFEDAIILAHDVGNNWEEAKALENAAIVYADIGKYDLALAYYRRGLSLKQDPDFKMGVLGNMGSVYNSIGDYGHALACYDSSLVVLEESMRKTKSHDILDTMQMAGLLISKGDNFVQMGQYDHALDNYNIALRFINGAKSYSFLYLVYQGRGRAFLLKKEYTKAVESYREAITVCAQYNNKMEEPDFLNALGLIYLEEGLVDSAGVYIHEGYTLALARSDSIELSRIYTSLGKFYMARKEYRDAASVLKLAADMFKVHDVLEGEKDALEALSDAYAALNEPDKALVAYREFIAVRDSIYNVAKANEWTRIQLQADYSADSLRQADNYHLTMQRQHTLTYSGYAGLAVMLLLAFFIYRNYSQQKKANATINKEKQVSDDLLRNILPEDVARELKVRGSVEARLFEDVTVMFTDFVDFTQAGERMSPQELVAELHHCFKAFDEITARYSIEKIKTVGDAYLAVSGMPVPCPTHAEDMVRAAVEMRDHMLARKAQLGDKTFGMRIGIHSGTVVAGIVGARKFAYDIWGDTVNTAARMEQYSDPGKINISQATYDLIKEKVVCEDRGEHFVKNKGVLHLYFVEA